MSENLEKRSFKKSYVVCTCKQVTLGEIIYAIKEQGATNIDDLEELTEAGSCCGCCRSQETDFGEEKMELYLSQILEKFVQRQKKMRETLEKEIKELIATNKGDIIEINSNLLQYFTQDELVGIRDDLLDKKSNFREENAPWLAELYENTKKDQLK